MGEFPVQCIRIIRKYRSGDHHYERSNITREVQPGRLLAMSMLLGRTGSMAYWTGGEMDACMRIQDVEKTCKDHAGM